MKELLFILTTSAGQVTMATAPDGWDESLIEWARSDKYWGVFRSFTIPLKFVAAGATALRTEFYTYGTKGVGDLIIQRLNKLTLQYSNAYLGTVDFGTFKDQDTCVEINVMDTGLAKLLKENGGTEYEVPVQIFSSSIGAAYSWYDGRTGATDRSFTSADIMDLVKLLLDKMTDGGLTAGTYGVKSDLLDGYARGETDEICVQVCSGENFAGDGTPGGQTFKTSFEDLYKSLVTWTGCGVGIEVINGIETIVIEPRSYFFVNDFVALDLGTVKNINITVSPKLSFNRLKIGYPAKEYQDYTMNDEPNATSLWKSPNSTNNVELDLSSKYRADSIGILELRSTQSDAASDDIFFIELIHKEGYVPEGYWELNRSSLAKKTGIATTWAIGNGSLTPRRCIQANQTWLDSCHFGHDSDSIVFTSGDNDLFNIEVKNWVPSAFVGNFVAERSPVALTTPALFQPLMIEFESALPSAMIDTMNGHPSELYSFTYEGQQYTGYIMQVKAKLAGRGSQKVTLLSSPYNDFSTLIR